jgi:integrase
MSVYLRPTGIYHFDFVIRGKRFHGTTGQKTRRAAEAYERRMRIEAAEGRLDDAAQLTLDEAAGKYWHEHGRHRGDADHVERRIAKLLTLIPKTTPLAEITTPVVSAAIQKRRGQTFKKGKDRRDEDGKLIRAKTYPVANGTVNRDVIQTLRPILRRAKTHWGAKGLPEIAWGELALSVPRETVRVYSPAEQAAWMAENGPTAALALRLLLTYGLRFGELFFALDAFEPDGEGGARLGWYKGRKKDVWHSVPLRADDAAEIAARVSRARAAKLDTIWFVEEVEEQPDGERKIKLAPLTYYGLQQRLRTSSKRAGIRQGRVIHGARHHVGTTVTRRSKLPKVTQRLLGHLDPRSTDRYVHALDEDVRAALEGVEVPRHSPDAKTRDRKTRKK